MLLGLLRFFKRLGPFGKISAGVLPVPIQEEAVQPSIQGIVVRDVPASTRSRVELIVRRPNPNTRTPEPRRSFAIGSEISESYFEHIVDRAAQRDQTTIHISLPERQFGIQHQPPDRTPVAQHDAGLWPWLPRIGLCSSVRPAHRQPANSDELPK